MAGEVKPTTPPMGKLHFRVPGSSAPRDFADKGNARNAYTSARKAVSVTACPSRKLVLLKI
jgi:hypothetical protein